MSDNFVTFKGNLTSDPELRFVGNDAVTTIRIASNRDFPGRDGQMRQETTFINVNCWRGLAQNIASSLSKGDRVTVTGRLRVRSYENANNQTVWVTEIEANEVSVSLLWQSATVTRNNKKSSTSPQLTEEMLDLPEDSSTF